MIKIFILLLLLLSNRLSSFNIKDGATEFYINNSNNNFTYIHYLRLNFELQPYEKVKIQFSIGNKLEEFKSLDNIKVIVWKIVLLYYFKYNLYIGIGDRYINYSPYTIHLEEWNDNIFKGIFVHYKSDRYNLYFDGFVGLHSEETNRIKFEGEYLKTDVGFINKYYIDKIQTESPTIWGGFKISKSWNRYFKNDLIYIRENYSLEKPVVGFISYYFFNNDIYQPSFYFNYNNKLFFDIIPILMIKKFTKYNGAGDYYGEGKHKLEIDYEKKEFVPAGEISFVIRNIYNYFLLNGKYTFTYRYIDEDYNPVHIDDGRLAENRGEDFLNDLLIGEKGYIINAEIPILKNHFWGIEYQAFINTFNQKKYFEKRYFLKQMIINKVNLLLMLQNKNGYLNEYGNINNLTGFIIILKGEISKNFYLQFQYIENKDNIKNNNIVLLKSVIKF